MALPLASIGNLFGVDGIIILAIGLLIFGRRLPEVGKNLGKTIVEFKKGLNGSYDDKNNTATPAEEPEEEAPPVAAAPPKRLAAGSRTSAAPARKRVVETEEV